jgi:predicted deacylase
MDLTACHVRCTLTVGVSGFAKHLPMRQHYPRTRKMPASKLKMTFDLDAPGRQVGDVMLRWSDNSNPLGYHPVQIISIRGSDGPTVLITGGTHGDEFEGPAAIMRLVQRLSPEILTGQVILIPALNAPALAASSRVNPLDGANLNRAFPGDPEGGPTAMLAHFVETRLLPRCSAAIDLHSGGKASVFAPCTLPTHAKDPDLYAKNLDLAHVFGLPLIWRLGVNNDARSVNSAAERVGVPMIAAELGGGGGTDPEITDQAEAGLLRILRHLGMIAEAPQANRALRMVELADPAASLYAPAEGLFDRAVAAGQEVKAGSFAGWFHFVTEPERASVSLTFPAAGLVLAHANRGMVRRGELLALVTQDVEGFGA